MTGGSSARSQPRSSEASSKGLFQLHSTSKAMVPEHASNRDNSDEKDSPADASVGSLQKIDDSAHRELNVDALLSRQRILRKLDFHLLPLVVLFYFLCFLDRSNVANARVAGMGKDLNLNGLKYNVAAAVFSIPYALGEVPSNIALKLTRPSRWLPSIMIAWGLVQTMMVFVNSYRGLIVARVFLGVAEAGLLPGVTYYLSLWYPRSKFAVRMSIFIAAGTISSAFGGLLAFAIEKMDGIGGVHGWQWIFCLEGILTILVAIIALCCMQDYPATATFLTAEEKLDLTDMLKEEFESTTHFDKKFIWQAISDYKTYLHIGIQLGILITAQSLSLFAPTIVNQLGFSSTRAQLLMIPIFVAGCLTTLLMGFLSDRFSRRGPFMVGCCLISLVGYLVLYTHKTPAVGYVGAVIGAMGVYPAVPLSFVWAGGNTAGELKRNVVIAMVIGLGNLGGVCASFIYFGGPKFHVGHGTIMGWLGLSIILSLVLILVYHRSNESKEASLRKDLEVREDKENAYAQLGDGSPFFRYTL